MQTAPESCQHPRQHPLHPRKLRQHPRHSLHHQHLGIPAFLTSPASPPASLNPLKNGPPRGGFGGRRTWRASLRSSERFFLRKLGRRRSENIAHTVFFFICQPVSAGDLFGLIGLGVRHERRARARARRTGTHALKLGWVSACSV